MPRLEELIPHLRNIWESNIFSNNGPYVQKFEKVCADIYGIDKDRVVCCSNATMGLTLAIKALDWKSSVDTVAYTFPATVQAISWNSLPYTYLDIHLDKHSAIKNKKQDSSNLLAILPYGCPFFELDFKDYESVIIDAASALGNTGKDMMRIINNADASVFSLHATKSLGVGEGGLVIFRETSKANIFRRLINFGFNEYKEIIEGGINGKMCEIMGAIGYLKLIDIKEIINSKNKVSSFYKKYLKNVSSLVYTVENHPWQFIPILLPETLKQKRSLVRDILKNKFGILTGVYYAPVHKYLCSNSNLPNTDKVGSLIISLPIYSSMSEKDVEYICSCLSESIRLAHEEEI